MNNKYFLTSLIVWLAIFFPLKVAAESDTLSPQTPRDFELKQNEEGTRTNPVRVKSKTINSLDNLAAMQQKYLEKRFPKYVWIGPCTVVEGDRFLQRIVIKIEEKLGAVCFDVTDVFKQLKRKSKKLATEIKVIEEAAIESKNAANHYGRENLVREGEPNPIVKKHKDGRVEIIKIPSVVSEKKIEGIAGDKQNGGDAGKQDKP